MLQYLGNVGAKVKVTVRKADADWNVRVGAWELSDSPMSSSAFNGAVFLSIHSAVSAHTAREVKCFHYFLQTSKRASAL